MYLRIGKEPIKFKGGPSNSGMPTCYEVEIIGIATIDDGFIAVEIMEPDADAFFRCKLNVDRDGLSESYEILTDGMTYRPILEENSGKSGREYAKHFSPIGHRLNWGDQQRIKSVINNFIDDVEMSPD